MTDKSKVVGVNKREKEKRRVIQVDGGSMLYWGCTVLSSMMAFRVILV